MKPEKINIAVIGGGISGISAAVRLTELSRQKNIPAEIRLLEGSQKLGGVISTINREGNILELGPDAIFTEKPWGIDFCKKIGLTDELIGTNPNFRTSFIATRGELLPVPEGFYLIGPASFIPFLKTPIFSWAGKIRMLGDLFIPPAKSNGDESLGSFVRRRLGTEALERMAQPMIGGIYSADPDQLSLKATFPQFLEMETRCGGVIKGLRNRSARIKNERVQGPRYGLFASLKTGMETLVKAAAQKIPPGTVRFGSEVEKIEVLSGTDKKFKLYGKNFELDADGICLAVPACQSARLVKSIDQELSSELEKITYASGITVNLVYNQTDIGRRLDGFGFVVPAVEGRLISGCTFSSIKFTNRSVSGKIVLRAFLGGPKAEPFLEKEDREIEIAVKKELTAILNFTAEPRFAVVQRHPRSLPQYRVGHLEGMKKIEERLSVLPGLALAGNGYYGTGIPDCVHSGELAAGSLINYFKGCFIGH